MSLGEDVKAAKEVFSDFATKPTSIIYVGIISILSISEWRRPTNRMGMTYKILILMLSFFIITIFNSQYFKAYWKNYSKRTD